MRNEHPSQKQLRALILSKLPAGESRTVVRHLLSGCPRCQAFTAKLWRGGEQEPQLDLVKLQGLAEQLKNEVALAPDLLDELLKHPRARRVLLIQNLEAFQTWSFCELLLEHAFEQGLEDPKDGVEWGELGVVLANTLSTDRYAAASVNDLRARAYTILGNAQRLNSTLTRAGVSFQKAWRLLRKGSGDPLELGNTAHFQEC